MGTYIFDDDFTSVLYAYQPVERELHTDLLGDDHNVDTRLDGPPIGQGPRSVPQVT